MRAFPLESYSTRCTISHRPAFMTGEPLFYRCLVCGEILVANQTVLEDGYSHRPPQVVCCGTPCLPLALCEDRALLDSHRMSFVIFGGYDRNTVRIEVDHGFHPMEADHRIDWIYLRTFQGGQLKRLPPRSRSFVNFSLADHDAFVYCDREICKMGREHCQFLCKRGLCAYAFCSRHGLFRLVLDQKAAASSE